MLLRSGRQKRERIGPPIARGREVAVSRRGLGFGREKLQAIGMNQRSARGTRQRVRRKLGAAPAAIDGGQAVGAAGAPTRYGPRICSRGAPVIRHA